MKFPRQIMVRAEKDGDIDYLIAHRNLDELESHHGENIAVYELKFIKKVEVKINIK